MFKKDGKEKSETEEAKTAEIEEKTTIETTEEAPKRSSEMFSLEKHMEELANWEKASFKRFSRWPEGKLVSTEEFNAKMALFTNRPVGG